jgi:hypothetical protein
MARPTRARTWAGLALASLGMTLPIALASPRSASAGALVTARARTSLLDALRTPELLDVQADDPSRDRARLAVDESDDTVWSGRPGETQWRWTSSFAHPVHVGLLRAHFGLSATSGVPTVFRWEVLPSDTARDHARTTCDPPSADDERWTPLPGAFDRPSAAAEMLAQPTRRSWFVDTHACALRLVIDQTNAGPPVLRDVQAIESAEDVLRGGHASDDGTYPGLDPSGAIDGSYSGRWAGAPGQSRWTLRVDLPTAEPIDRIRLVLGFDATSTPRGAHGDGGRAYAVSWAPLHYALEVSDDGQRFFPVANDPTRPDGTAIPLRRRLVTLQEPRSVRSIRLVMIGATGESGLPEADAVPVVREIAAYRADDERPVLAAPWILSINANPAAQSHRTPGGEVTNDAYHAKFLQARMTQLLPALADDDRYARALGPRGEPLDAPPHEVAGGVLESIEGDDPQLDTAFLTGNSPPPIAILSGSNDWDYDAKSGPDAAHPKRWHWDPLRDARGGGMGQLAAAVQNRVAPFLGFCGGAQILALLEARRGEGSPASDARLIDRILSRTTGEPIRGFATPLDVERAWPTDPHPLHAKIEFLPSDPLFADVAGPFGRSVTQALPESHADAIRPDAFGPGRPLARFEVVAKSAFCSAGVPATSTTRLRDDAFPNPAGTGYCAPVPEAFRSRDPAWPVIGAQFHAEQRDFASAAPGDPPESTADPRLFLAAAYETMIDAYVRLAP